MVSAKLDALVIGGGIIGLAVARELTKKWSDVAVLEKEKRLGEGQTLRSSGVLHSGVYYDPKSLRAKICPSGNRRLQEYATKHKIPWKLTQKLIVATEPHEEATLEFLKERGTKNGIEGLEILSARDVKRRVPDIHCTAALMVPTCGIIDAGEYFRILKAEVTRYEGALAMTQHEVIGINPKRDSVEVDVKTPHGNEKYEAKFVINTAGTGSIAIAKMVDPNFPYSMSFKRGEYVGYRTRAGVDIKGINIYPVPEVSEEGNVGSLGIHLTPTLDSDGNISQYVQVGPSAQTVAEDSDFTSNLYHVKHFYEAARRIARSLRLDELRKGHVGIQARLDGHPDWILQRDSVCSRIIHAVGIKSPGLTSSLGIGEYIVHEVMEM